MIVVFQQKPFVVVVVAVAEGWGGEDSADPAACPAWQGYPQVGGSGRLLPHCPNAKLNLCIKKPSLSRLEQMHRYMAGFRAIYL